MSSESNRERLPGGGKWFRSVIRLLVQAHDALTNFTFAIAIAAVAYLTLVLAYEVLARYGLKSPTGWAPDTSAFSFAAVTFLAAPKLAWKSGHANMDLLVKSLPPTPALWLRRATLLVSVIVCGLVVWFGMLELVRLYQRGVTMIAVTPIPKWWLMAAIVYALASMGLYYLRHLICSWLSGCDFAVTENRST